MGEVTKIEWCDHTFNPWIGCQKVSPGCDHCYAEAMMDHRYGRVQWGPHGERKRTSEANWKKPRQWAKAANGKRPRVFCASLADWLDNQVPEQWREDLAVLIDDTPQLDWLLLTKRPENFNKLGPWHHDDIPPNVWFGVTCEDQERADRRIPILIEIPATVRFISYEPAIGPVDFSRWLAVDLVNLSIGHHWTERTGEVSKLDWIICGGESGHEARYMEPAWASLVRTQCAAAGVPFFMKQMTGKKPIPDDLLVRQFPRNED